MGKFDNVFPEIVLIIFSRIEIAYLQCLEARKILNTGYFMHCGDWRRA